MLIVRDYDQEFESSKLNWHWTQPAGLTINTHAHDETAEAPSEEIRGASSSPRSTDTSPLTQRSLGTRNASAARVRKPPRKVKSAKASLQSELELLLSGMRCDFDHLKEQCAALHREQASQTAELYQLKDRLAAASTCNMVLQCDLASFDQASQGTANELAWNT